MQKYLSASSKFVGFASNDSLQISARSIVMNSNATKRRKNKSNSHNQHVLGAKWPSKNHCVVNFFHPENNSVDADKVVENVGTVKAQAMTRTNTVCITKIEMSNSDEAMQLWMKFSSCPPAGVINVCPERQYTTLDKLQKSHNKKQKKRCYSEYWSNSEVEKGIEEGKLVTGSLRINSKKFDHAFISDEDGRDILINGLSERNRALEGDIVAVQINDKSQWIVGSIEQAAGKPSSHKEVIDKVKNLEIKDVSAVKKLNNGNVDFQFKHSRKTGKVVAILEKRHCRSATGHIKVDSFTAKDYVLFSPTASIFPRLLLPKSDIKAQLANENLDKILFVAKIKEWTAFSVFPLGELGEIIGNKGEVEAETRRILVDYNIDHSEFSESLVNSLPHNLSISNEERSRRKDFTGECIFSIDPSTAKDLDDALHCKEISEGIYEVGVHIADVSHFVKPGSEVDLVASQRCTSVYLVQRVIPMLPSILCEELCSLNPAVEKLAFSVVWRITEKGEILFEWFGKSVICSCAKLSYDHAQTFINNPTEDFANSTEQFPEISCGFSLTDIQKKVLVLHKIGQNLRLQRFSNGALQLDQVKLSYTLADNGLPTGCYAHERKASNELIEEFMLLANIAVARKLYKSQPSLAFLRCHPAPKENMMDDFVSHCRSIGLEIDSTSSGSLARSIRDCCGDDELSMQRRHALFMFAIKPQQLALYFCAGAEPNKEKFRHYALNVPLYTHFTSPIRRYADVIVHRQLSKAIGIEGNNACDEKSTDELQEQAKVCNLRKYNSKSAQDASIELFLSLLVKNYGPFESTAMVMYVYDRSFDVLSIEYGVVKRIFVDCIPGVMSRFEQNVSSKSHVVNSLLLKWTDQIDKDNEGCDEPTPIEPLAFNDNVDGIEQRIDIFSIVKIQLMKPINESALSIRAVLLKPSPEDLV